jgi:transcription antitermination factor NusG
MLHADSYSFDIEAGKRAVWYALYTRHQHEKTVAQILSSKGFETLLPLYTTARRWKDRTKLISLPLFPCYLFLQGGVEERRLDIVTTPGLLAIVSNAGHPTEVPLREIEAIRKAVDCGARLEPHPYLKCGDRVRIKCGSLEGLEGILVRSRNIYRLVLSVEMLGKSVAIEVDAYVVEKVNRNHADDHEIMRGAERGQVQFQHSLS